MQLHVLGSSGGIDTSKFTSSYKINSSILLDAGTGLNKLSVEQQEQITHVFLTHAHLDHICCLPLLLDNLFDNLTQPLQIYALPEVIQVIQTHLFNWHIWPDFTQLPSPDNPVAQLNTLNFGQSVQLEGLTVTPFQVDHVVPSCGFHLVDDQGTTLAYTGDTTLSPKLIDSLNQLGPLHTLLTECAFPDSMRQIANQAKHLTPELIAQLIAQLKYLPQNLALTHFKPSLAATIAQEINQLNLSCPTIFLQEVSQLNLAGQTT